MKILSHFLTLALLLGFVACKPKPEAPVESAPAPVAEVAKKNLPAPLGIAPSWSLPDLEGNTVSFSQFKGKVVVVDFWATWCPPCREEIPGYIELQDKYGKDGLVIIGVSLDRGGPKIVKPFVEKTGMNYVVVMGDNSTVESYGGFQGIPTTFIIDREGNIREKKTGAEEKEVFEKRLTKYLN